MGSEEQDGETESNDALEGDPGSSETPVSGQPGGGLDGEETKETETTEASDEDEGDDAEGS